jgi:activator of 2-hydroxyglutaryl-CoA dehydratase
VRGLQEALGRSVNVSEEGHFMGALGAALFALERAEAGARGEPVAEGAGRTSPCS